VSRRFSRRERRAIFKRAGRCCEECGCRLYTGNAHADHAVPFSRGGETSIDNGRALCAACNLKKGNRMSINDLVRAVKLRVWQQRLVAAWRRAVVQLKNVKNFLAVVATGAGKTKGAVFIAAEMLIRREIDRVIVLTSSISTIGEHRAKGVSGHGWLGAFQEAGLNALHRNGEGVAMMPRDVQVAVMHYSAAVHGVDELLDVMMDKRTLLILDEPQHLRDAESDDDGFNEQADDAKAWGAAVTPLLSACAYSLLLTATPIRTDRERVPGMRYERDESDRFWLVQSDFNYSYGEALADGHVRDVTFYWQDAQARWIENGDEKTATFRDGDVSDKGRTAQLRAFLNPSSESFNAMLSKGLASLQRMRIEDVKQTGEAQAGLMIVAMDVKHAERIAKHLRDTHGIDPVLVKSEDPSAQGKIQAFRRDNTRQVLVSIGMVAEGTDIPRLRVLVFATNKLTRLHFIQLVGRILRVTLDADGQRCPQVQNAEVFMPAHELLIAYSREFRDAHLKMRDKGTGGGEMQPGTPAVALSSAPTLVGAVVAASAEDLSPAALACIATFRAKHGLHTVDDLTLYNMMRSVGQWPASFDQPAHPSTPADGPPDSDGITGEFAHVMHPALLRVAHDLVPAVARRELPNVPRDAAIPITRAKYNRLAGIVSDEERSRVRLVDLIGRLRAALSTNVFTKVDA
jgi:superfamily II DNA or RNA helicase